ncbi:MAG: hypothetical protein MUC96_17810, partial [Myxococcaceae bacterium]|nr:hypothetical protein [Myxococcaceae bacterium]
TGFRVAEEARRLARDEGVHLVLHLGDQVYLDLPTRQNLPKDEVALLKVQCPGARRSRRARRR